MIIKEPSKFRKTFYRIVTLPLAPFSRFHHTVRGALFHIRFVDLINKMIHYYLKPTKVYPYNLSLVMCVKDEAEYIREWIEYYLLQGVDHFYIYNNNGTDNTEEVLSKYIKEGLITWIEWPGVDQQFAIYNNAVDSYKDSTRWMGFVDCDEFIVPLNHKTLKEFLKEYEKFSQLIIYWVMYGSGGHMQKTEGLVIERFTKHAKGVDIFTKAIVNPRAVLYAGVHSSIVLGKTVNEKGEELPNKKIKPTADLIRCNHYVTKSWEEYQKKAAKGRVTIVPDKLDDTFFTRHLKESSEIEEKELMEPFVQKIKSEL